MIEESVMSGAAARTGDFSKEEIYNYRKKVRWGVV